MDKRHSEKDREYGPFTKYTWYDEFGTLVFSHFGAARPASKRLIRLLMTPPSYHKDVLLSQQPPPDPGISGANASTHHQKRIYGSAEKNMSIIFIKATHKMQKNAYVTANMSGIARIKGKKSSFGERPSLYRSQN